jgi:hypothetical protein
LTNKLAFVPRLGLFGTFLLLKQKQKAQQAIRGRPAVELICTILFYKTLDVTNDKIIVKQMKDWTSKNNKD